MKKYSRVLAGILAVLLSAGCTGLYAAAQSLTLPATRQKQSFPTG